MTYSMTYLAALFTMLCIPCSLNAMNLTKNQFATIKKVLDAHAEQEDSKTEARAYATIINHTHVLDRFLDTCPEYAQQITNIIISNIRKSDKIDPIDKGIVRLIDFKQLFLGERTQERLDNVLKKIKSPKK